MATTRNLALLLAIIMAAIALAISVAVARVIAGHGVATPAIAAAASLSIPDMHHDM